MANVSQERRIIMSSCQTDINEQALRLLLEKGFTCLPSMDITEEEFLFLKRIGIFAAKRDSEFLLVCKQA